jgi:CheY-like chemotaxis protein
MISLPWSSPDEAGDEFDLTDTGTPERRPLILLAEDHEANIAAISGFLMNRYRLLIARNGLEAIAQAQEQGPEVILMDMQMPVLNGLDAISRLRQDQNLKRIPIIALTALTTPGERERCLAAGANVYLSKPVSKRGLLEAIEGQLPSYKVIE